jgi:hypothetical protein
LTDPGIRLEYGSQSDPGIAALIAQLGQRLKVRKHMVVMPGDQQGLNVRKVFVERGAADAGAVRDLGHGHGEQTPLLDELTNRIEDGLPHFLPV